MSRKKQCSCGCGFKVDPRTDLRHRQLRGPQHVSGSTAARLLLLTSATPRRRTSDVSMSTASSGSVSTTSMTTSSQDPDTAINKHVPSGVEETQDELAADRRRQDAVQNFAKELRESRAGWVSDSSLETGFSDDDGSIAPPTPFDLFDSEEEDTYSPADEAAEKGHEGLSAWEILGEDFEVHAANSAARGIKCLSDADVALIRAFHYKLNTHTSDSSFEKLRYAFPESSLPSLKHSRNRITFLSGFKAVWYDCCQNSCICYTGEYEELDRCPRPGCGLPRYNPDGTPVKQFSYLPIIPRLVALRGNASFCHKMDYRAKGFVYNPDKSSDIFSGRHYQKICQEKVRIPHETLPHLHFSDPRDIALAITWDGFAPFRRRKKTAWALVALNCNLHPSIRFLLDYLIALGVVPGPKKPWDSDSFLWPFYVELWSLAVGVKAFDAVSQELFLQCAYLILAFGDIPAMALLMSMKGHNGLCPCRFCRIQGISVPNGGRTLYVPLDRSRHPNPGPIKKYDPWDLPLRTHTSVAEDAKWVQSAPNATESNRRAQETGIKQLSALTHISSITFPASFPYDFMHLIFENIIKNLVLLWTQEFGEPGEGTGQYYLQQKVWDAIGDATAASGGTIPSSFGAHCANISKDRSYYIAETWSFWAIHIAPILLHRRFKRGIYYSNFVKLIGLINICLQFEMSGADQLQVRRGFIEWVEEYEKLYYQYDPERLALCPLVIHAVLHIADGIDEMGPVWAYWAFVIERYCGSLQPAIRSRRFPFSTLNRHVAEQAQLSQIKLIYNLHDELVLKQKPEPHSQLRLSGDYGDYMLLPPKCVLDPVPQGTLHKIYSNLVTRYEQPTSEIRKHLPSAFVQYGKVRIEPGSDVIHGREAVRLREDSRDASFVRYHQYVDRNARRCGLAANFDPEPQVFFGQLQCIFVVPLSRSICGINEGTTLHLAMIRSCKLLPNRNSLTSASYKDFGRTEVVDLTTVQCVVGRVYDRGIWSIVDRSGSFPP